VDNALKSQVGLAMGIFEMGDLAGNDVGWRLRQGLNLVGENATGRVVGERYSSLADSLCERGWFGQKTKQGWYKYDPSAPRKPLESADTLQLIEEHRNAMGIAPRVISDDEIVERCMYALVNEGFRILDEGIAAGPADIDVVYVNGYGFPRYRGGP
ncbi:EHHADH, partial [Symbiodinium microadriaticum]